MIINKLHLFIEKVLHNQNKGCNFTEPKQNKMELTAAQLKEAKSVAKQYGNLSIVSKKIKDAFYEEDCGGCFEGYLNFLSNKFSPELQLRFENARKALTMTAKQHLH